MILNFFDINSRKPSQRRSIINQSAYKVSTNYNKFGYDYFDNKKLGLGYGGYVYDGRFKHSAKKIINHYKLKKNSKILEIGCAKGFIIKEFFDLGMKVYGLDFSKYAINESLSEIKDRLIYWDITRGTTFPNNYFDFIYCKETIPHINIKKIPKMIEEIHRIVKKKTNIFIEIQTSSNKKGLSKIKLWDPTHKTLLLKKEWIKLFKNNDYEGDFYFKNLV
jgi:ubiquinone/menaquinone biosynthesis C-methylase UbiE